MNREQLKKRNREIAAKLKSKKVSAKQLAKEYAISREQVYRAAAKADTYADTPPVRMTSGLLFSEMASTGLRRFGGRVDDEYTREFRYLNKRIAIYREMGDDPICAAVFQASKMILRRATLTATPGGDTDADKKAAEWLNTAFNDMSQSRFDIVDNALGGALQYGFQLAEIVYKLRRGLAADPSSKYDDGKIGWRKFVFIAPESLDPSEEWIFDEHGGMAGFRQRAITQAEVVKVPIDKTILFRTTSEKGNPEGRSIFRAMYIPWYMKKNLEEIEGISAERMGAGLPVIYAGENVPKEGTEYNDLKEIVTNVRADEQAGVFIPYSKMGGGAREGEGVLFEFMSPPSKGVVDIHQVISRYEQRMAMTGLAQFIHLGMNQVGARSLGESTQDFFILAVEGWLDYLVDTLNRYAVDRLFALNKFPGLTAYPYFVHESVTQVDLASFANSINSLVGASLITPSADLEKHLLKMFDLPDNTKLYEIYEQKNRAREEGMKRLAEGGAPNVEQGERPKADEKPDKPPRKPGKPGEAFADVRGGGPGARTREIVAVNGYQRELERAYEEWSDDTARKLTAADDDSREEIVLAALLALLALMQRLGHEHLPEAVELGLDGTTPFADVYGALEEAIDENDEYLASSLIPDIRRKLEGALSDQDILDALAVGAGVAALAGLLATFAGRVAQYAGAFWKLLNNARGMAADELGVPVTWYLDARAKHCDDCPRWGSPEGTEYNSYAEMLATTGDMQPADGVACGHNCRCKLEFGK